MDIPISSNQTLFSTIVFARGLQKIGSIPEIPREDVHALTHDLLPF
jgi:hypothetical protein